ncbi:MAG: cupin domain-containing protein [Archangium sp.]
MEELETGYSLERHVEGQSRHLDAPVLRLELARDADELRRGESWRLHGHNAKTLMKAPHLRVVLIALRAGASLGEHRAPGPITLQTLSGHLRLKLPGQVVEAPTGCLLALERPPLHDVEALQDSLLLLTLSWPGEQERTPAQ